MKKSYNDIPVPAGGQPIDYKDGVFQIPDRPIIPFIEGDGTGRDIWRASRRVLDAAVEKAFGGKKHIAWYEVLAGEKAFNSRGSWLPDDSVEALRDFRIALKGPLTTPVGGGIRSLNVTLRQVLDLYACVRPVRYFEGVPSPVKYPERMNVVIFRENTEDVYAGIEWRSGTPEAKQVIDFLNEGLLKSTGRQIRTDSGIGIKPISPTATGRLMRRALNYAIENNRRVVTLVHKGNIMKFTEGAFRDWGYALAKAEFREQIVTERESWILGNLDKDPNLTVEQNAAMIEPGLENATESFRQQIYTEVKQALDAIGPDAEPLHVARFGQRFDAQGVIAGSPDANRCIGYLTKYLTKHVADCHRAQTPAQHEHAERLADALRYEPCSPTCANWLRYGMQPRNPRPGLRPGHCKGKAHRREHLGYAGRRVLVSRKWSGKTLTDHRADRQAWILATLGLPTADPGRYTWEPVSPGDPDHMPNAQRLLHIVADRQRWHAALTLARARASGQPAPQLPATGQAA